MLKEGVRVTLPQRRSQGQQSSAAQRDPRVHVVVPAGCCRVTLMPPGLLPRPLEEAQLLVWPCEVGALTAQTGPVVAAKSRTGAFESEGRAELKIAAEGEVLSSL